jgi:hypothetical protein
MAKSDPKKEPESHPDAWERFRTAVHVMTKAGPQHRKSKLKGAEEPKKAKRKVKAGPRL